MCSLSSNATADEGFRKAGKKDQERFEKNLARLANEDSVEKALGLHVRLNSEPPVASWRRHPELRKIGRTRIGSHRAFITGKHTDCHYKIIYIKAFKRTEEDAEEDPRFQRKILEALCDKSERMIPLPVEKETEDEDA